MPSTLPRLPVRVSPGLRDLLAQAGPVNAATRGLIILGARAAGLDVAPVAREVWALLARPELAAELRDALADLAAELRAPASARALASGVTRDTTGDATRDTPPPPPSAEGLLDTLLADVGIEV